MDNAREFSSRLLVLLRCEQGAMADFLVTLSDFDRRRLWVELGYSSLFHYLNRELGMSKGAAHYRKTAVELIQRVPAVAQPLRDGRLCITSIIELAKVVTPENQEEVLPRFFHCSRQEAKAVSAELCPAEAVPTRTVVTAMPIFMAEGLVPHASSSSTVELPATPPAPALAESATVAVRRPIPPHLAEAEPLTADLRRLHMTVSKRFMEKLEAAKDALSHSHAGADLEAILEAGLDLVIERAAKRRGIVAKPRKAAPPPDSSAEGGDDGAGTVPAAVKREVWIRDGGRCRWPTSDGGVCGSTCRVQFDHVIPRARGGKSTVPNLRLLCATHNDLAARQVYGDAWMDRFTAAAGRTAPIRTGDSRSSPHPPP